MQKYKYYPIHCLTKLTSINSNFQDDDQLYVQIDSPHENNASDEQIRPSGLRQNSYRDDEVERSHNDDGSKMPCVFF